MNQPIRKKLPHAVPQWVPSGSWFFITINCDPRGQNHLCRADVGDAVLAAVKFNHEECAWHCRLCLLMPDHLHAILAFPADGGIQSVIQNWKRFVARKAGVLWQRDFFDHRLRNLDELQEKTSYILLNPVRKGLCKRAEDWVWVYRPNDRLPPLVGG
jgi:REP element-mobilizing transposase RayT